jgi:hypothetical protein
MVVCSDKIPPVPRNRKLSKFRSEPFCGRDLFMRSEIPEVFENLSVQVPGYQRAEHAGGGITDEVKVADLLCYDAQTWTGTESLYLWAEDLAEGHVLEIQGRPIGDGCAGPGGPGGGGRQARQRVRYHICLTWYIHQLVSVFRNECQLALLAARGRR